MLTFISCAKTMASHCSLKVPEVTVPYFEAEAVRNALEMSQVSAAELEKLLKVNAKIAAENKVRFHDFCSEDNHPMPAIGVFNVIDHPPAFHHHRWHRGEVRFQKDQLGDLCGSIASGCHSNRAIRILQCKNIVDAVSCHTDRMPSTL